MKVLTLKQPWAWAVFNGKDIENRDWSTNYRGPLAIHSSKLLHKDNYSDVAYWIRRETGVVVPDYEDLILGSVLGTVIVTDCVRASNSPWFMGKYGLVLADPKRLEKAIPARGMPGLWEIPSLYRESVGPIGGLQ